MKIRLALLAAVPALLLTSCYVTPEGGPYRPPGPRPGPGYRDDHRHDHDRDRYGRDRDHDRDRYDRDRDRDRDRHDHDHDRDRRPGYGSTDPRSPYSPGGRVVLPSEARRVSYRGQVYYTHRNVWYRPSGSSYVIVRSPY